MDKIQVKNHAKPAAGRKRMCVDTIRFPDDPVFPMTPVR